MTATLIITALLGIIVAGIGWWRAHVAGDRERAALVAHEREVAEHAATRDALDREREVARQLHRELHDLEEMLHACDDPAAIRARLRGLLSPPADAPDA